VPFALPVVLVLEGGMIAALQFVNDQPTVLGRPGAFRPAIIAGCADPVFIEAQCKHRTLDLALVYNLQGSDRVARGVLDLHSSLYRRIGPIPEEQLQGHPPTEAHAHHRQPGRFRHLSAIAVLPLLHQPR
jgi:hypothetical protein